MTREGVKENKWKGRLEGKNFSEAARKSPGNGKTGPRERGPGGLQGEGSLSEREDRSVRGVRKLCCSATQPIRRVGEARIDMRA